MIILIDAREAFDKVQHTFMIKKKTSPETKYEGTISQHKTGHI